MWRNVLHRVYPASTAESQTQLLNQSRRSTAGSSSLRPSTLNRTRSRKSSVAAIKKDIRSKKGWEAFKELATFYLVMLRPCVVVTLWMFAFFATLSYLVPNVLCRTSIASTPVSAPSGNNRLRRSGRFARPLTTFITSGKIDRNHV